MNRRQVLGAVFGAGLTTALCTACDSPEPPARTNVVDPGTPAPKPSPTPVLPAAPLTGRPVTAAEIAQRAAVAVPLRVAGGSSPAGLDAADLIYQEYAEAGTLHVTAVFQSRDTERIGPVTEIRPVDVRTLDALRPVVGFTGGPTGFLRQFTESGLVGVTPARHRAAFRDGYTSTTALRQAAGSGGSAPTPLFDHAPPGTPLAAEGLRAASELTVAVPGRPAQVWRYDSSSASWLGQMGQVRVPVSTVVVLTMPYRTITVNKPSQRSMPGAKVYGEGDAQVLSGPFVARARWRKPGERMVCHVTDRVGYQIRPLPGPAWVVYAPTTAKVTIG